jgi:hypothetical protein
MLRSLPTAALACFLACVLLTPAGEAAAAGVHSTATASQKVTFRNQTGIQLLLTTTTPYDFGQVSPLAVVNPAGRENRATVWSNGAWRLQVRAAGPNFVQSPTGTGTIPVSRLQVTGTTAATVSTTDQQISSGNPTTILGRRVNINYRLALLWPDPANAAGSSYSQTLVYTAVTP